MGFVSGMCHAITPPKNNKRFYSAPSRGAKAVQTLPTQPENARFGLSPDKNCSTALAFNQHPTDYRYSITGT
jgi:hypothetical protein